MAQLTVLWFDRHEEARAVWRRRPRQVDAALVWVDGDRRARIERDERDGIDWAMVVGALFVLPVSSPLHPIPIRRPPQLGLTDAVVRRTAGSLVPGSAAIVGLAGGANRLVWLAGRHHGRRLSVPLSTVERDRLAHPLPA
ncbi:hypothetical protein Athai_37260 [Actinocatenispora thailandica]|uniref:Uncharacterized protein n=1 Tax=Actinocatenispora thailandica TaxID=227318 RepID=A0A7R7DQZ2_9ACTN|nr:hypothetical protein [Actinocatenispora thailandica]BCJ36223.1 hypothetical protein Athai_37260 [Actinocatenispora thailandica]